MSDKNYAWAPHTLCSLHHEMLTRLRNIYLFLKALFDYVSNLPLSESHFCPSMTFLLVFLFHLFLLKARVVMWRLESIWRRGMSDDAKMKTFYFLSYARCCIYSSQLDPSSMCFLKARTLLDISGMEKLLLWLKWSKWMKKIEDFLKLYFLEW